MPIDDPTELFDLFDAEGHALGRSKARALVHRDGDWHRSVHVWVVHTSDEGPSVVLQRRSLTKDTHPGKVDVSVAGHLRSGEPGGAKEAAVREAEEEIGLTLDVAELVRLGLRRHVGRREPSHLDRELQEIFFVTTSRALETLKPDPDEVLGVLAASLPDARAIARGEVERIRVREVRSGDREPRHGTLEREELLLSPDGYFARALESITRKLAGAEEGEWVLGEDDS
jgi:isopentenyldiphosphate isomerase